ncbi:hypothetical protein MAUB1S_02965 [Mycolicibacterium aubagnense]
MIKKSPRLCSGCDTVVDVIAYTSSQGGVYCSACLVDAPIGSITHALGAPSLSELIYRPGDRVHAGIAGIREEVTGTVVDIRFHLDGVGGNRVSYQVRLDVPFDDLDVDPGHWYACRDLRPAVDDLDAELAALVAGTL